MTLLDRSFFTSRSIIASSLAGLLHVGRNCCWGGSSKSIFIPITVERISLSEVISFHAPKECPMHPAAKVSQRVIRYFFNFDSINGRNLLTADLIFASEAVISCLSRSCLGRISFSPRSGGPFPKKTAVSHLCGVSLMLCLTMSCVAGSLYCGQNVGVGR